MLYAPCHIVMMTHLEWLFVCSFLQVFPVGSDHSVRLVNRRLLQAAAAPPSQRHAAAASRSARDPRPAAHDINEVGLAQCSSSPQLQGT